MLSKRTAIYFWSSTQRKHTLTNTWSSTHIKIHYQSSESKQSNTEHDGRKSNEPLNANKIITNNQMRSQFVSIGQD
jgi:hypothetical protein